MQPVPERQKSNISESDVFYWSLCCAVLQGSCCMRQILAQQHTFLVRPIMLADHLDTVAVRNLGRTCLHGRRIGLSEAVPGVTAALTCGHDVLRFNFPGSLVGFRGQLLALALAHAIILHITRST